MPSASKLTNALIIYYTEGFICICKILRVIG